MGVKNFGEPEAAGLSRRMGQRHSARFRSRVVAVAAALGVAAAIAACGGSSDDGGGSGSGGASTGAARRAESITVAANSAPLSLDPTKNGSTADMQLYATLAYEPLIKLLPDGRLGPGLATSWRYLDEQQKVFELTLRRGAKFSDGTPVTPQAVVDSFRYQKAGLFTAYAAGIKSVRATGPDTVGLELVEPNSAIAMLMTQRFRIGQVIGSRGTANPRVLGTRTIGAGPYMVDPSATIANDHYTFVPNPHYYDQDAIHFDRFTIRVISNPQTALNALQSRQVALMSGNAALAPAAESAGLKVTSALSAWYGILLFDRDGEVARPLANEKVRQALNYATDREGITQALFGEYGEPNSEPSVAGYEGQGFVPEYQDHYPYDPAKARALLAEAGYPDGFSLTIGATNGFGNGTDMTQAVADDWGKVGVKVDIKDYQDIGAMIPPWQAKKLPAVAGYYDTEPSPIFTKNTIDNDGNLMNPWNSEDAELSTLLEKAHATTDPTEEGDAWAAVTRRVVDLGWFVPISSGAAVYFSDPDLQGVEISPVAFAQDPTLLHSK